MKKAALFMIIALITGLGLVGCGGPSVIKIGVIAEMSGSIPSVGTSCKNATALAASEINNAGGISVGGSKYKVELAVRDCDNDPKKAVSATRELIQKEGVQAIVGPNSTANALPAANEAEKEKVVLVTPWSTSPNTTVTASGVPKKYVFRVCVTAAYEGDQLARFAKGTLGAGTAAVLYDGTADILKIQAEDFRASFTASGGTVTAYETFKPTDTDFSAQLSRIKAASPGVLFLAAYDNNVPLILKQVKASDISTQILSSDGWSSPEATSQAGAAAEGAYVFNMYSAQMKDPSTQKFVKAYTARYAEAPDDVAALSYDSMNLLKNGLEGSGKLDRQSLDDSLLKFRQLDGATGRTRFPSDSRNPVRGAVILQVRNGQYVLSTQLYAKATREDVVAIVNEAVAYARANGKEKTLAEFSNPEGLFNRGELYIFAYDFNGNVLAHGGNKAFIGQNLINMKDPNGVMVIQELIKRAQKGSGWLYYMWDNPQTGKVEPKVGYVVKVDDNWWLGSGIYMP